MMKRAFTVIETIVVVSILGLVLSTIIGAYTLIFKNVEQAKLENQANLIRQGMSRTLLENLDGFTISSEVAVFTKSNPNTDENYIALQKNRWIPMFSVEDTNSKISDVTPDGTGIKLPISGGLITNNKIVNTSEYIARLKSFWNSQSYNLPFTPFLYISQKYFNTADGYIPYNDFYVVLLPDEYSHLMKTNKRKRDDILNSIFKVAAKSCELRDSATPFIDGEKIIEFSNCTRVDNFKDIDNEVASGKFIDIDYLSLDVYKSNDTELAQLASDMGVNLKNLKTLRKNIRFFSLSNKRDILNAYEESKKKVNTYSKSMKDWASIQMAVYENLVAKLGGSFNIDYFMSNTNISDNNILKDYIPQSLYSSSLLNKNDCASGTTAKDVCWNTKNDTIVITGKGINNPLIGMVILKSEYGTSKKNGDSYDRLATFNLEPVITENVVDITLNRALAPGSHNILGVRATDEGNGNGFGEAYRYGFANAKSYSIINPVSTSNRYDFEQNTPSDETKLAPYSAVINNVFPWLYFKIKPNEGKFGYYESRVVPELR